MNIRIAKKIVEKFNANTAGCTVYTMIQIHTAHRMIGRMLEPDKVRLYQEALASSRAVAPKRVEANVGVMKVVIDAGPDGQLGTDDDEVSITKADPPSGDAALTSLTVAELREKAKTTGLTGYSKMKKADLIEALS